MGAKRPLNGTSKVNTQTDRQTDRQTDKQTNTHIWTNQLIERIGPEGRCFENRDGLNYIFKDFKTVVVVSMDW